MVLCDTPPIPISVGDKQRGLIASPASTSPQQTHANKMVLTSPPYNETTTPTTPDSNNKIALLNTDASP